MLILESNRLTINDMSIQFKKPKEWQNKYSESSRSNIVKLRMKLKAQNKVQQKEFSKPKVGSFKKKKKKVF